MYGRLTIYNSEWQSPESTLPTSSRILRPDLCSKAYTRGLLLASNVHVLDAFVVCVENRSPMVTNHQ